MTLSPFESQPGRMVSNQRLVPFMMRGMVSALGLQEISAAVHDPHIVSVVK
ncbi:MAG: hypothetical protein M3P30_09355 [Chloroflexota bacterium]|nr:hypothetical protein [Chloroflexota bacterium]